MKYILGIAALLATSAALVLMGCVAELGSRGEATESDGSRVGEAASAQVRAFITPWSGNAYLRGEPHMNASIVGTRSSWDEIWISCYVTGQLVQGPGGQSSIWYRLVNGSYISATWVYSGSYAPIASQCYPTM